MTANAPQGGQLASIGGATAGGGAGGNGSGSGASAVGARALANAMLPPPPRAPKRKEMVLEEDEWTATLEAIIERDFFPELAKLESKVAWLQAVRSGDPEQIRNAQLLIAQRRAAAAAGGRPATGATPAGAPLFTPGGTAARALAGDTPYIPGLPQGLPLRDQRPTTGSLPRGGTSAEQYAGEESSSQLQGGVAVAPPGVSLDRFLAAHTSEDNASFQEVLEDVNKRRRLRAAAHLAPPPDPQPVPLITDGLGTIEQEKGTLVPWKFEPKNALYYDGSNRETVPYSDAELAAMAQGAPKAINHGATRFPSHLAASASATPSASSGGGGSVTAGGSGGAVGAAVAAPRGGAAAVAAAGGGTRGFDILATPVFDPGAEETPFMTWGDIEATPLRIEAEDLPPGNFFEGGPSFFIREGSRKEQAGLQLASKAGASLRKKGTGLRGGTPLVTTAMAAAAAARRPGTGATGSGGSARPGSSRPPTAPAHKPLSEAARRLAGSMGKSSRAAAAAADDMGLRATYRGPTPASGRRATAAGTPATSAGGFGSSWSTRPTPSRGGSVSAAASPAVHRTLEEEEARVQALLCTRQKEEEAKMQLVLARQAAQRALQERQPAEAAAEQQQPTAGGELTAGLLHI